jgi:hypothetical protein
MPARLLETAFDAHDAITLELAPLAAISTKGNIAASPA